MFKYSDTKIITPAKTYDPNNEFDEEYFEFGLFMSRREYKVINRRLQRGREASVREGKYVSNRPPYGYVRKRLDKGFTLEPHPEQAETVRMIFELYTRGEEREDGERRRPGVSLIARRLDALKIPPQRNATWSPSSVRDILINPVYIGKVRWNFRPGVKKMADGRIVRTRPRSGTDKCVIADGLHEAIVAPEVFNLAQERMSKNPPSPVTERGTVKNPLAGLVVCGKCGRSMVRRPQRGDRPDTLICPDASCGNVSSALSIVENRILEGLRVWAGGYRLDWDSVPPGRSAAVEEARRRALRKIETELAGLESQRDGIHNLLERGVYTDETFYLRIREVEARVKKLADKRESLAKELASDETRRKKRLKAVPKSERLIDVYHELSTPAAKNQLLKEVLEKAVYVKAKSGRWHSEPDEFTITLYPRLPRSLL